MGGEKTKQNQQTQTQNKTEYTASPEEQQLIKLQLSQLQQFAPLQNQLNQNAGNLINALLQGQSLPGYLNQLPGGISAEDQAKAATSLTSKLNPQYQALGIFDSGTAFKDTSSQIANQITLPSAQFNLQNLQQLLSMAVGGQSQVQQPMLTTQGQLGQSLAGLKTINQSGSGSFSGTTIGMNPFLKSFQTGFGQKLGEGFGTKISGWNPYDVFPK